MRFSPKTLFVLLTAAFFCLASCGKSNPDTPTPTPVSTTYVEFLVVYLDGQDALISQSYELSVDGETADVPTSKMADVTVDESYSWISTYMKGFLLDHDITTGFKIVKYSIGSLEKGQTVKCGIKTFKQIKKISSSDKLDVLDSYFLLVNGGQQTSSTYVCTCTYEALDEICYTLTQSMDISYTVN